jgi:hypothetical protein
VNTFMEADPGHWPASASIQIITDQEYAEAGKVLLRTIDGHGRAISIFLDAGRAEAFANAVLKAAQAT